MFSTTDGESYAPQVEAAANSTPWPAVSPTDPQGPMDEPLAAAVQHMCHTIKLFFDELPLPRFVKGLIIAFIVLNLVRSTSLWLPYVVPCAITYLVYRVVWTIVVQPARPNQSKFHRGPYPPSKGQAVTMPFAGVGPAPAIPPIPAKVTKKEAKRRRQNWRRQLREHLAAKPLEQRLTELVGSMFVAAVVSTVASLLVCLIAADPFSKELFAWLASVGTLACWALMVPAKLSEGKVEDQAPMRFMQLLLGAIVGVLAWALADWLMLPLTLWNSWGIQPHDSLLSNAVGLAKFGPNQNLAAGNLELPLQMFAAYFAFLFVLVAWWEQTEATRGSRVNVWTIAWCGLLAWLLHFIWWFPQPLGLGLAAMVAFSLQFASPWLAPSRRRSIAEEGLA